MDYKRANRAYLYMILATYGLIVVVTLWYSVGGNEINILINNVLSEAVVLLPAIAAVLYSGEKLSVLAPMHKIKASSVFLTLVYVIALFPMVAFVNTISMFFVENTVTELSGEIMEMPMWTMLLSIGIFGPFVEEFVFRGVLLQSFQRTGRIIGSIVLSAVMFGMMHMNFNQFGYGAVMGVMFALLFEATGSVLAPFIAHAFFNSIEVVMMYMSADFLDSATSLADEYMGEFSELVTPFEVAYLFVAAVVFGVVAFFIVRKIAAIEGRAEFFSNIPKCRKQGYKLVTVPAVIAMTLCLAYMIIYAFLD